MSSKQPVYASEDVLDANESAVLKQQSLYINLSMFAALALKCQENNERSKEVAGLRVVFAMRLCQDDFAIQQQPGSVCKLNACQVSDVVRTLPSRQNWGELVQLMCDCNWGVFWFASKAKQANKSRFNEDVNIFLCAHSRSDTLKVYSTVLCENLCLPLNRTIFERAIDEQARDAARDAVRTEVQTFCANMKVVSIDVYLKYELRIHLGAPVFKSDRTINIVVITLQPINEKGEFMTTEQLNAFEGQGYCPWFKVRHVDAFHASCGRIDTHLSCSRPTVTCAFAAQMPKEADWSDYLWPLICAMDYTYAKADKARALFFFILFYGFHSYFDRLEDGSLVHKNHSIGDQKIDFFLILFETLFNLVKTSMNDRFVKVDTASADVRDRIVASSIRILRLTSEPYVQGLATDAYTFFFGNSADFSFRVQQVFEVSDRYISNGGDVVQALGFSRFATFSGCECTEESVCSNCGHCIPCSLDFKCDNIDFSQCLEPNCSALLCQSCGVATNHFCSQHCNVALKLKSIGQKSITLVAQLTAAVKKITTLEKQKLAREEQDDKTMKLHEADAAAASLIASEAAESVAALATPKRAEGVQKTRNKKNRRNGKQASLVVDYYPVLESNEQCEQSDESHARIAEKALNDANVKNAELTKELGVRVEECAKLQENAKRIDELWSALGEKDASLTRIKQQEFEAREEARNAQAFVEELTEILESQRKKHVKEMEIAMASSTQQPTPSLDIATIKYALDTEQCVVPDCIKGKEEELKMFELLHKTALDAAAATTKIASLKADAAKAAENFDAQKADNVLQMAKIREDHRAALDKVKEEKDFALKQAETALVDKGQLSYAIQASVHHVLHERIGLNSGARDLILQKIRDQLTFYASSANHGHRPTAGARYLNVNELFNYGHVLRAYLISLNAICGTEDMTAIVHAVEGSNGKIQMHEDSFGQIFLAFSSN